MWTPLGVQLDDKFFAFYDVQKEIGKTKYGILWKQVKFNPIIHSKGITLARQIWRKKKKYQRDQTFFQSERRYSKFICIATFWNMSST